MVGLYVNCIYEAPVASEGDVDSHGLPLVEPGAEAAAFHGARKRQTVQQYVDVARVGGIVNLAGDVVCETPFGVVAQYGVYHQGMGAVLRHGVSEGEEAAMESGAVVRLYGAEGYRDTLGCRRARSRKHPSGHGGEGAGQGRGIAQIFGMAYLHGIGADGFRGIQRDCAGAVFLHPYAGGAVAPEHVGGESDGLVGGAFGAGDGL